jgi:hypothetical protein
MKKAMSVMFVLLFTAILTGAGASIASAATTPSGYPVAPYWFTAIDAGGQFITPTFQPDTWNSAQFMVRDTANEVYRLTAHPNYYPYGDDPVTATQTTVVTDIQVYNPKDGIYVDCIEGGTFVAPFEYQQLTPVATLPYLQFSVTFTKYNNSDGSVAATYSYTPAYFSLSKVTPQP